MLNPSSAEAPVRDLAPDLADHFVQCSKLGRYLTVFDGSRFVISDDFRPARTVEPVATAVASIFSKDPLVAQAALLPLGIVADRDASRRRERYEELFSLIEEQTLTGAVRESAGALLASGFHESRIKAIEAELGEQINPARMRYRAFLEMVRRLIEKRISARAFRDEFLDFTYSVAGKLDFGIYSFCIDRIFVNGHIPLKVKAFLAEEIIKYPPLIRRELISNVLVVAGADSSLVQFVRSLITSRLDPEGATEIYLLEALKSSHVSPEDIESSLAGRSITEVRARAAAALA